MPTLRVATEITASMEDCFDLDCDIDLHLEAMLT